MNEIDPKLLEILVCPACKDKVTPEEEKLRCMGCGRRYPVREGIPVMLIEESTPPQKNAGAS